MKIQSLIFQNTKRSYASLFIDYCQTSNVFNFLFNLEEKYLISFTKTL